MTRANDIFSGIGRHIVDTITKESAEKIPSEAIEHISQEAKNMNPSILQQPDGTFDQNGSHHELNDLLCCNIQQSKSEVRDTCDKVENVHQLKEEDVQLLKESTTVEVQRRESLKNIKVWYCCRKLLMLTTLYTIQIVPILGSPAKELNKEKFKEKFDLIYVSSRACGILDLSSCPSLVSSLMKAKGRLCIEGVKYLSHITSKQKSEYTSKIIQLVQRNNDLHPIPGSYQTII
jgi:hypothetical protein